jgi:hypothetical protein
MNAQIIPGKCRILANPAGFEFSSVASDCQILLELAQEIISFIGTLFVPT